MENVHTSIDIEGLVISMGGKLDKLPLLSPERCIYEIPKRLRKINEETYTPLHVSIGPLHHGKEGLEPMEECKWRCLQDFLQRTQKRLEEFVKFVGEREERVRQCYAKTISYESEKFVEMILVDAAFIIEVLLRFCFPRLIPANDCIFSKPSIIDDINYDLRLLENQLPFFVLEDLYKIANIKVGSNQGNTPTFIELTGKYFEMEVGLEEFPADIDSSEVKHFVDFLRRSLIPRGRSRKTTQRKRIVEFRHCATDLHEAGVKFKVGSSKNLFDIKLSGDVLEIPYINIVDQTESLLRNLLAFEQCHYPNVCYMSDYVVFMDSLINTPKDVELLVEGKVIENWLGDSEGVSNLFNKLATGINIFPHNFYFSEVCKELNDYCESPWHKWKANLSHHYFQTPWQVLSIVVAAILLILTFIQTVCSIVK